MATTGELFRLSEQIYLHKTISKLSLAVESSQILKAVSPRSHCEETCQTCIREGNNIQSTSQAYKWQ